LWAGVFARAAPEPARAVPSNAGQSERPFAERYGAELERHFSSDTTDMAWASPTETALSQAFTGPGFSGSSLLAVECRSKLCRIEVEHDDEDARLRFRERMVQESVLANTTAFGQPIDEDRRHFVMFVSRPHEALPAPPSG
jgi:hypothetical protein